jgi:hypothetical protein
VAALAMGGAPVAFGGTCVLFAPHFEHALQFGDFFRSRALRPLGLEPLRLERRRHGLQLRLEIRRCGDAAVAATTRCLLTRFPQRAAKAVRLLSRGRHLALQRLDPLGVLRRTHRRLAISLLGRGGRQSEFLVRARAGRLRIGELPLERGNLFLELLGLQQSSVT